MGLVTLEACFAEEPFLGCVFNHKEVGGRTPRPVVMYNQGEQSGVKRPAPGAQQAQYGPLCSELVAKKVPGRLRELGN